MMARRLWPRRCTAKHLRFAAVPPIPLCPTGAEGPRRCRTSRANSTVSTDAKAGQSARKTSHLLAACLHGAVLHRCAVARTSAATRCAARSSGIDSPSVASAVPANSCAMACRHERFAAPGHVGGGGRRPAAAARTRPPHVGRAAEPGVPVRAGLATNGSWRCSTRRCRTWSAGW